MPSNGNGKVKLIVLVVAILSLLGGVFAFGAGHVIANDKASRARDTGQTGEIVRVEMESNEKLNHAVHVQTVATAALDTKIERVLTKLEYIEAKL